MLRLSDLTYASRNLGPLSLTLEAGQVVLLCGPSGSGKSTLCALLTGELEPTSGEVSRSGSVGSLTTDVEGQLLGATVAQELELGRRAGLETVSAELGAVRESLVSVWAGREGEDPQHLSAGEQQLLLLTSMALGAFPLLLLDEGLSSLDQASFENVCRALRALARAGRLVMVVSHELRVLPWVDRCVGLREGRLAFEVAIQDFVWGHLETARMWPGTLMGRQRPPGDSVLRSLERESPGWSAAFVPPSTRAEPLLSYEGRDFSLGRGGALGLAGVAGAGKSRLLATLAGLDRLPDWQRSDTGYRVLLRQHAPSVLWRRTVEAELEASMAEGRLRGSGGSPGLASLVEIEQSWRYRSPRSLSQGQVKLVACLCLLLQRPDVLLLDQPFAGLDAELRGHLARRLNDYLADGGRIVLSTHLPDEILIYTGSLLVLGESRPLWHGAGSDYFQDEPDPRLGLPWYLGL